MGRCVLFLVHVGDSACWQLHALPPPSVIKMTSPCGFALVKGPISVSVIIGDGREFQSLAVKYSKDLL